MAETEKNGEADAADKISQGAEALEEGYDRLREYGDKGLDYLTQIGGGLTEFVRREPLIAVGAAFLVGYLAARLLRRLPS